MNIFHTTIIQSKTSSALVKYELVDESSKNKNQLNFNFNEINLIASFKNNEIHEKNFKNQVIVNYKYELVLDGYKKYLSNFCEGYNTQLVYVEERFYPICNVKKQKIKNEYLKNDGINLIWKNLMKSHDAGKKLEEITLWFKSFYNFELGMQFLRETLGNNFEWSNKEIDEFRYLVKELDFQKGLLVLKSFSPTDFQISLVNDFYKNIFYFYLINYLEKPLEKDIILQKSNVLVLQSLLSIQEFQENHFLDILYEFMWNEIDLGESSSKEIIKTKTFRYFFKTNIEPSIYYNVINTIGITKETAFEYHTSLKKIKKYKLLDPSNYQNILILKLINLEKYQKTLLKNINDNNRILEKLLYYKDLDFDIKKDLVTLNQSKNIENPIFIIVILVVFLVILMILFYIEFLSYFKYRIINYTFETRIFLKELFKYLKK